MECQVPWSFEDIVSLVEKASDRILGTSCRPQSRPMPEGGAVPGGPQSRQYKHSLDAYAGNNVPGQIWSAYKSRKNETSSDSYKLYETLTDLLTPSTLECVLQNMTDPKKLTAPRNILPAYLRLKQNNLDKEEWMVDSENKRVLTSRWQCHKQFKTKERKSYGSTQGTNAIFEVCMGTGP